MSDDSSSGDWLPAGWSMEVKARRNGNSYTCYTDPAKELKFYSKTDVLCHLNNTQVDHPKSENDNQGTKRHFAVNYVVEKSSAEGLPPGWIKEIRVRKKGGKVRRDPFYIDPLCGHVFRSMKDAFRYLETGELGRLASKPKDQDLADAEMKGDKLSSPVEVEGPNSAYSGRQGVRTRSSKLGVAMKSEQVFVSNCKKRSVSESQHNSGKEGIAMGRIEVPETNTLEQREVKNDSSGSMSISIPAVEAPPEKLSSEDGKEKQGNGEIQIGRSKLKRKKWANLPRRASKRLANFKTMSESESKTDKEASQIPVMSSAEVKANAAVNYLNSPVEQTQNPGAKNMQDVKQGNNIPELHAPYVETSEKDDKERYPIPEAHVEGVETDCKKDEKEGSPIPEAHAQCIETDSGQDEKTGFQWMNVDPCIEFAIKTLTGAIPLGEEDKAGENPGINLDLPDTNVGSSLDLPFGNCWSDPCIEFAVKTLKGEIPVADDLGIHDFFELQLSSSRNRAQNMTTLSNEGLNNTWQGDISYQCYNGAPAARPFHRQQALAAPMFLHTGSVVSLQESGGGVGRYQHVGKNGRHPRPRIIK